MKGQDKPYHDLSVREQLQTQMSDFFIFTIPLAPVHERIHHVPQPEHPVREPHLLGREPLHLWRTGEAFFAYFRISIHRKMLPF